MTTLDVAGVTLTINAQGVELRSGWLFGQQISVLDATRIRDWLNANYPVAPRAGAGTKCSC